MGKERKQTGMKGMKGRGKIEKLTDWQGRPNGQADSQLGTGTTVGKKLSYFLTASGR